MSKVTDINEYIDQRKYRRIADKLAEDQAKLPLYPVGELSMEEYLRENGITVFGEIT